MFVLESFEQTLFSNVDFKKLTNQHFAWCCQNSFFKIWTFSKTYPGFCCLEKSKHLPVFTPPSACCPRHLFPILFCWKLFQIFTHKPLSILHSDQTSHRKVPSTKWERKGYLSEMKTNKDVFIKPMCCVCSYSFETSCIPFGWHRQLCDPRFFIPHKHITATHTTWCYKEPIWLQSQFSIRGVQDEDPIIFNWTQRVWLIGMDGREFVMLPRACGRGRQQFGLAWILAASSRTAAFALREKGCISFAKLTFSVWGMKQTNAATFSGWHIVSCRQIQFWMTWIVLFNPIPSVFCWSKNHHKWRPMVQVFAVVAMPGRNEGWGRMFWSDDHKCTARNPQNWWFVPFIHRKMKVNHFESHPNRIVQNMVTT